MEKVLKVIWGFLTSSKMKTFYWQTANGFLAILILTIGDLDWKFAPALFSVLAIMSKHINKTYLMKKKYGGSN